MSYVTGRLTGRDMRDIRYGLLMSQKALAEKLGYSHKIRISEYERDVVPIPAHIQAAMVALWEGRSPRGTAVRDWNRREGWSP